MYRHPEKQSRFFPFEEKFLVVSQGGLFTVKLRSTLRRQTGSSCAADDRRAQKAAAAARSCLIDELTAFGFASPALSADTMMRLRVGKLVTQNIAVQWGRAGQVRGRIVEFSKRSRNRLLRLGARLKADVGGLMVTCTYRENMRDHARAKAHLALLSKWLTYHFPKMACVWRLEYQSRGAIHFHLLIFNVHYIDSAALTKYWQALTGDDSYPDIKPIRSRRKVMSYISKYIAKLGQDSLPGDDSGFIYVPKSENFTGRFWGIVNRKCLPLAKEHVMLVMGDRQVLSNIRRYARRKWGGLSRRIQGFSLFVNDASQWLRMVEYELMRAAPA